MVVALGEDPGLVHLTDVGDAPVGRTGALVVVGGTPGAAAGNGAFQTLLLRLGLTGDAAQLLQPPPVVPPAGDAAVCVPMR